MNIVHIGKLSLAHDMWPKKIEQLLKVAMLYKVVCSNITAVDPF